MRLLIIGASGVLGSRLYSDTIKKKWNVAGTYCAHEHDGLFYLDVRDKNSLEKVFNLFKPEAIVMAGGITDVDLCTTKPKLAEDVNIKGTLNLVEKIKEYDSKLVYVSTDYIFDGEGGLYKETDKPNPINNYGRTKLEAENIVTSKLKDSLIVRTAQLYGMDNTGKNFTVKIIRNMRKGKKVYAADDLYSTPTYAGSLSEIAIKLIEKGIVGVYHGAGAEFINRYDYVYKIADMFNLDKKLIQKVKLKDLKLTAERPRLGGLDITRAKKILNNAWLDCSEGLNILKKDMGEL